MAKLIPDTYQQQVGMWVLALLILGVFLRLWGIGFGLPFVYHPDEHNLTFHALEAGANRLNPGWFEYPSLMMYLLGGLYLVFYQILHWLGQVPDTAAFWQYYKTNPSGFTVIGRLLIVVMGAYTLGVVFRLGRWAYGRTTGLFALAFLGVCFLHVRDSHFITVDVPLTLFCTLAVYWALLGCCKGEGYFRFAAVAAGLAVGTKYTGILVLCPLWVAVWQVPAWSHRKRLKTALMLSLICVAVFLLTTPYAVLDWPSFWRDIRYQFYTTENAEPIYGGGGLPWLTYLSGELRWGLGLPFELLALMGVVYAFRRRFRSDWILLSFVLVYFFFIGLWSRHWGRWVLPIIPVMLLLAARFWAEVVLPRFRGKQHSDWLFPLATILLMLPSLYLCVRSNSMLASRLDTRTLAFIYVRENPEYFQSPILYTAFSIPGMGDGQYTIQDYLEEGQFWEEPHLAVPILENRILKDRPAFSSGQRHRLSFPTLEEIQAKGLETGYPIRFVILSSFYRDIAYDPRVMEAYPGLADYRRFYEDLQREGKLVFHVSPAKEGQSIPFHPENIYAPTLYLNRFERPGPTIEIWEIDR